MAAWVKRALVLSGLWIVVVLPIATAAQPQPEYSEAKESTPRSGANGEPDREVILVDPLEDPNEPEDRLVLPVRRHHEGLEVPLPARLLEEPLLGPVFP